jgi:predicted nucleic acid-binding protein
MMRIALDTNAVNKIADTPGLVDRIQTAAEERPFTIIGNPMVRHELESTSDPSRRSQLLGVWEALPRTDVLASGGFYDIGLEYGEAYYSDGNSLEQARTRGRGGAPDAVIAVTAVDQADVLVTDDGPMTRNVQASCVTCKVWSFELFRKFILGDTNKAIGSEP